MKKLSELTIKELKKLRAEVEGEIKRRERDQTTCIWGIQGAAIPPTSPALEKTWSGETYIS